jgi:hypothetical protein
MIDQVHEQIRVLENRIGSLKEEVDSLQITTRHFIRPWYREGSALVAALALVFSFGTTAVSYFKSTQQERQAYHQELRSLMFAIGKLPREIFNFQEKHRTNQQAVSGFSSLINNENVILSKQASQIIWRIPDLVSASEHLYVGKALTDSNLLDQASAHFRAALAKASDVNEITAAYRSLGQVAYMKRDVTNGRYYYGKAKEVLDSGRIKLPNPAFKTWFNAQTELRWAQAEQMINNCREFQSHLAAAVELANEIGNAFGAPIRAEATQIAATGCPPRNPNFPIATNRNAN